MSLCVDTLTVPTMLLNYFVCGHMRSVADLLMATRAAANIACFAVGSGPRRRDLHCNTGNTQRLRVIHLVSRRILFHVSCALTSPVLFHDCFSDGTHCNPDICCAQGLLAAAASLVPCCGKCLVAILFLAWPDFSKFNGHGVTVTNLRREDFAMYHRGNILW